MAGISSIKIGARPGVSRARPPGPRRRPEQALQIAAVDWMRRFLPPPPDGPVWSACNPVPAKTKIVAKLSKAMGMRAGWPDVIGCVRGQLFGIEFKADAGGQSVVQRQVMVDIRLAGGVYYVVRSLEELMDVFGAMGVKTRTMRVV